MLIIAVAHHDAIKLSSPPHQVNFPAEGDRPAHGKKDIVRLEKVYNERFAMEQRLAAKGEVKPGSFVLLKKKVFTSPIPTVCLHACILPLCT